jgi:hypothetical protein
MENLMSTVEGRVRRISRELRELERVIAPEGPLSHATAQRVMGSLQRLLDEIEEMRAARLLSGDAPALRQALDEYLLSLRNLQGPLARLGLYLQTERERLSTALQETGSARAWTNAQRLTHPEN